MGASGCGQEHGDHHHHHHHHHVGNKISMRKRFYRLCFAIGLFLLVFILDKAIDLAEVNTGLPSWVLPFVLYFIVYLIQGADILKNAFSGVKSGYILDENFLMTIASLGAFAMGIYSGCIGMEPDGFEEGCAVILFFCVGEFFQDWALGKSERALKVMLETYGVEDKHHHHANTKAESFITRFARIYTPIVVGLAAAIAIIPPVIGMITGSGNIYVSPATSNIFSGPLDLTWTTWIYRSLSFLVVSCPCALVISIPLSFSVAISTAGRNGVLVKSAESIERLGGDTVLTASPIDEKSNVMAVTDTPEKGNAHSGNYLAIMKDAVNGIPFIKKLSRHTKHIILENIIAAIGIKIVVLILSAFGISNMWVAIISDEGIAFLAVLNALRIGLYRKTSEENGQD